MNRMLKVLALALLGCAAANAQSPREDLAAHPERSAGIYHSYEYRPGVQTPAPKGYEPFYISHYGRHGSRRHTSASVYELPLDMLRKASAEGNLTPKGRDLLTRAEVLAADADKRLGDLTPRGVEEHRGIAERMFRSWPGVFSTAGKRECRVESRSTLVPRCILSMAAFNERLKELNPAIAMTRESSERYLYYMSNGEGGRAARKAAEVVADSMRRARLHPGRLMAELFADPAVVPHEDAMQLMDRLFALASIAQDVSYLNISLYDIFTGEELYALWECENARRYMGMGPSARFGDPLVSDARPLLRNIVETAQETIDGRTGLSASLRFGHDVNIIPLLALMQVDGTSARVVSVDQIASEWCLQEVSPMAANVQFIFFRNPKTDDVLVKILHNEREARLPVGPGPYYSWAALRDYCKGLYE